MNSRACRSAKTSSAGVADARLPAGGARKVSMALTTACPGVQRSRHARRESVPTLRRDARLVGLRLTFLSKCPTTAKTLQGVIAKKTAARTTPEEDPEFQIAPMIDILLVLLVFFMSISTSEVLQVSQNVVLPVAKDAKGKNGRAPARAQVMVNVILECDQQRRQQLGEISTR